MKTTVEVTETNFEREVLKSNQPVLVEFAPGWSLQSMTLDRVLEEIPSEYLNYLKIARVKLDQSPSLGLWYGIRERVLTQQDGHSILVGHSYGGAVITEAGTDPTVAGLVYIAAHMPDAGSQGTRRSLGSN